MDTQPRATPFLFIGNALCLDFINTEIVADGRRVSLIQDYEDLRAWIVEAGVVDAARLKELEATWGTEARTQIVQQALALRSTLRIMAERIAARQAVSDEVIEAINGWLERRKGYARLTCTGEGYATTFCYEENLAGLLTPIAASAAELLVHTDLTRVRKCGNPRCILFFYDTSKNHARRWCSMDLCGNRMKVAAHYRRGRRAQAGTADSTPATDCTG